MTAAEIQDEVWQALPATKHVAGRQRVDRIVSDALRQWPVPVLAQCDAEQTNVVGLHLARRLEQRERNEYGMGFLAFWILGGIISGIVQHLVKRWLENRTEMLEACR